MLTKKIIATFLAFVLVLPLLGISPGITYAEDDGESMENLLSDDSYDNGEEADNLLDEDSSGEDPLDEDPFDEDSANLIDDTSSDTRVSPADVIEFVYLDEKIVALDQEQYIAFGLLNENAEITQAEISFMKSNTEEIISFPASVIVENAALFTLVFSELEDATSYRLVEISYNIVGFDDVFKADFLALNEEQESDGYFFDVVTPEVLEIFTSDPTEDGEITAFIITNDGDFIAIDSIEEALELIDTENMLSSVTGEQADAFKASYSAPGNPVEPLIGASSVAASLVSFLIPLQTPVAVSLSRENYLIVALDPGHGDKDSGAAHNGMLEKDLNWKIAKACYDELLKYTGVSPVLTRTENENPGLQTRVDRAVSYGADVFISLHNNAGGGTGAEVWIPNDTAYLNSQTHVPSEELGNKILAQLNSLGLANRGVKMRDNTANEKYPDGSVADYYGVINAARRAGIPGIIVEHAFMDRADDAAKLKDDDFLKSLGIADAKAIVEQYGLVTDVSAQKIASVRYRSHIGGLGWQRYVYDQKVSGTTGKNKGIESFTVELQNLKTAGSIRYRANVTGQGWQGWKSSGQDAGTTGLSTNIQALQIELTGSIASTYDVFYRTYVTEFGWLGWAKNGATAGTAGKGYFVEAFQVVVVPKGTAAPGSTKTPFKEGGTPPASIAYQAHVANIGWMNDVLDGAVAGTTGRGLRMEALKISLISPPFNGDIEYNAHCANLGWQGWKKNGAVAGTTGQARQVESIQIRLTGEMANKYDVYYRTHCANIGWLGWAKNGESAGSAGFGFRLEALEIKLVAKGNAAPGSTSEAFRQPYYIQYQAHVANIGWMNQVFDGAVAGTTGQARQMEALRISLFAQPVTGNIEYNAHCANLGWQGWKSNGAVAGTTGQSRRMEAIQIRLTGEMANKYDVYYRTHCANIGWMGWAKNGESAGTAGYGYCLEALEIKLVVKGKAAPGVTSGAFKEPSPGPGTGSGSGSTGFLIMGSTNTTVDQMVKRYNATGNTYPSSTYSSKGAATIRDFCQIIYEEATAEGVKPEVVFCQAMKETGWLRFGGDVKPEQNNFCGLGATGGGVGGASFGTVREGIRAQVQHLKAYAVPGLKASDLKYPCVDPRFDLVTKGVAPTVEGLGGRWAANTNYGYEIVKMIEELYKS